MRTASCISKLELLNFRGVHPPDSYNATTPFLFPSPPFSSVPFLLFNGDLGYHYGKIVKLKMFVGEF